MNIWRKQENEWGEEVETSALIRRVVSLRRDENPPRSLTASVDGKRARARPFRTIINMFTGDVRVIIPELVRRDKARD